ncbi:MAG TPA: matrixin family metalloprotease, partial [Gaiellaceae bacterium]|nr:matrixin family metalloprotease [Gaiellaceae bacterium]
TQGHVVLIDPTAAGYGWYLGGSLVGRVDLMTVIRHEIGHALGFEHEDASEHAVMSGTITLTGPVGSVSASVAAPVWSGPSATDAAWIAWHADPATIGCASGRWIYLAKPRRFAGLFEARPRRLMPSKR